MKVLIIGSSKLPTPAVKGGAVPNLIEEIIIEQEKHNDIELYFCGIYDRKAEENSEKYKNTHFIWAKLSKIAVIFDAIICFILKNILKKEKILSLGYVFRIISFSNFVAKTLKYNDFDKVVFENSIPILRSLRMHGNLAKYANKYYIHMHSVPKRYFGMEKIFTNCAKLIVVSDYVGSEIMKDKRVGINKQQIVTMFNCIDTNRFKPYSATEIEKFRKKYNISKNDKIICFAGRICKEKGIEEVIKAFKIVSENNFKLMIVGSNFYGTKLTSPYENKIKDLSKEIENNVVFTGYVDYSDMHEIYSLSDVVVLPSIWEEPAGMTIIEAMACKKPVITTLSGGIPEYVGNNSCIILKRDNNIINNLSKEISNVLKNALYREKVSNNSYKQSKKFDMDYYYRQFINIINK